MKSNISIIGAGIGGLTMALFLKQKGFNVHIYESAEAIKPIGAGIVMANNAMQIYKQLGIHKKIEAAGNRISKMYITNVHFQELAAFELIDFEQKYNVHNIAIHRADLQHILAEEFGYENIHLSKRLSHITLNNNVQLTFTDGSIEACDYLIGADGLRSTVRNIIFGNCVLRNAHQPCWRGVCNYNVPIEKQHGAIEIWDKGKRFGYVKINEQQVYWYALINEKDVHDLEPNLVDYFQSFGTEVLNIIDTTDKNQIYKSDIIDLKPIATWHTNNICLLGDAAHATTPNLGQGACQAVEDAYVIAKLLDTGMPISEVFASYNKIRIKKAHKVVHTSWMLGKLAHLKNPIAVFFRNSFMRWTPPSINKKQLATLFTLD